MYKLNNNIKLFLTNNFSNLYKINNQILFGINNEKPTKSFELLKIFNADYIIRKMFIIFFNIIKKIPSQY